MESEAMEHAGPITQLIGGEHDLDHVCRALKRFAFRMRPTAFGGVHQTCADEAELECREAFRNHFIQDFQPSLKGWKREPFTIANLGARYEWGAIGVAETHFATPRAKKGFKLMMVKINSHVGVMPGIDGPTYGAINRYEVGSTCCGALANLLDDDGEGPYFDALSEIFTSEGIDRLAALRDIELIDPNLRDLLAAVVNARLQARSAIVDIQHHDHDGPTLYLVLPCVTLNRPHRDMELVCGLYVADMRHGAGENKVEYTGLGDDPTAYQVTQERGKLRVEDIEMGSCRAARDHRDRVLNTWMGQAREPVSATPEMEDLLGRVTRKEHHDHEKAKLMLKAMLPVMTVVAPIPLAIVLFGEGVVGIHHLYRAHRLAMNMTGDEEARRVLAEVEALVDQLSPERARNVVEMLAGHYG